MRAAMTMTREVSIAAGRRSLAAALQVPAAARGVVLFVHGSGVDRHDAHQRYVARKLRKAGFATLQPDLLDARQARDRHNVFDIDLQCASLLQAVRWVERAPWRRNLPLAYFATGIGAGVVLMAAAKQPGHTAAIVCCGGRPDTALFWAPRVRAPTLLVVETEDRPYLLTYDKLGGAKELVVVPTESHCFDEPQAAEAVVQHANRWFSAHLAPVHEPAEQKE